MLEACGEILVIEDGTVSIPPREFMNETDMDGVRIPDSVKEIGAYAFAGCDRLLDAELPGSVLKIGAGAFAGCGSLERITIPDSVKEIGAGAFMGCGSLSSVKLGASVERIGRRAFMNCGLKRVTIPDPVVRIGAGAFAGCGLLESIEAGPGCRRYKSADGALLSRSGRKLVCLAAGCRPGPRGEYGIPDSVAEIEEAAFDGCGYLRSVTIPDSVVKIGRRAFAGCGLTGVTIPGSVARIGAFAFEGCAELADIRVNPGNESFMSAGGVLLSRDGTRLLCCPRGKTGVYAVPDSVTEIGEGAFWGCERLTAVTIPGSAAVIGADAFGECRGLAEMTLPASVARIGKGAFSYCAHLARVTIENPECAVAGAPGTIPPAAVICAPAGSAAEAYAKKHGNRFSALQRV